MAILSINTFFPNHDPKKNLGKLFATSKRSTIYRLNKRGKKLMMDVYGIKVDKLQVVYQTDVLNKYGDRYL